MKKLLILLTLMVAVFGFTAGASADLVCTNCKGDVRNVDCPPALGQAGACLINEFDFDNNAANVLATHGYCLPIGGLEKYKAIFAVCNCTNAAVFVPGKRIAVRMEILVNGLTGEKGAYWSGTGVPGIMAWDDFTSHALACAAGAQARSFGAPSFWRADGTTAVAAVALGLDPTCTVAVGSRATILTTPASIDVVAALDGVYWWVDVPPVRIDPAVLKNGELVSVKISIYDPTIPLPICPACIVTICDCVIDIARVCCVTAVSTTLTFPYFTSLTEGEWWNGISITNPTAAAGTCTLTAREQDGSTGTASVSIAANSMLSDTLPNLGWSGTGLGGSPCYITADCNYGGAFGFAFLGNNDLAESMGYLPWTVLP